MMPNALEMHDDGTSQEIDLRKDTLSSDKVYCIVDDSTKSVYVWQGRKAHVRKKFVGAQTASSIRAKYGMEFRVRAIEEGMETPAFLHALNNED